ncbi:MAG: hypothetical protein PVH37_08805 [Desulfobacterales bacterium]|jgi:hypothetical protein
MDLKILEHTPPWEWPQDAGPYFLKILSDDQIGESDRCLAAELAGDFTVISDEIAHALLAITGNPNESEKLRAISVISLGTALANADMMGFEDPDDIIISEKTFIEIQETLHKLFVDTDISTDVRRRILEASVRAPQEWHGENVHAAFSSDEEAWRLTAVFCMQYIRGFDDQILEALNDKNADIHYHAVCAAGNWAVDAAWPHIRALVDGDATDKPLLLAAIDAVVNIRPREAAEVLGDFINDDDQEVVDAVYEALAMAEALNELDDEDEDDEILK